MSRSSWHTDQFAEPKRSTAALRDFAARVAGDASPKLALDAGCGAGANMAHLAPAFPETRWVGIDIDDANVAAGRSLLPADRFTIERGDIFRLVETFGRDHFDVTFSFMVLSWIEDYERALTEMLVVTRRWVFILNLFAETDVDAFVRVVGRHDGPQRGYDEHYNVYSLPRFEAFARAHGATEVIAEPSTSTSTCRSRRRPPAWAPGPSGSRAGAGCSSAARCGCRGGWSGYDSSSAAMTRSCASSSRSAEEGMLTPCWCSRVATGTGPVA